MVAIANLVPPGINFFLTISEACKPFTGKLNSQFTEVLKLLNTQY
jgi:hypothetical protein